MVEIIALHIFFLGSLGLCCHNLFRAIKRPVTSWAMISSGYSSTALRIGRSYRIFSYGVLTLTFFVALIISSYQIIIEL